MSEIPGALEKIDQKEVEYKSAVSESTMTKIGGSINGLIEVGNEPVGTVVQSILTVAQFNSIRPATAWVRMEGQSIAGSDLETLSGLSSLPDMVTGKRFLRQTDSDGNMLTLEAGAMESHSHTITNGSGNSSHTAQTRTVTDALTVSATSTSAVGGSETRPINMYINFFIKINNSI